MGFGGEILVNKEPKVYGFFMAEKEKGKRFPAIVEFEVVK